MSDVTVLALGGNSLIDPSQPPTVANQFALTAAAMGPVADLISAGERLVITHGNGPQVGFMLLRVELSKNVLHEVALDSLVADTQGALGYMIQRSLRELLHYRGRQDEVASVITEVFVDPEDPALAHPDKPIGKFYTAAEAAELADRHGWTMVEDAHRGHRRVVPSPEPRGIVQLETIRRLCDAGVTVIACGGGGIPVVEDPDGHTRGIEGVIDKDRASALLALELGAKRLLITTGIDYVYVDFHGPNERALRDVTLAEVEELDRAGHFAPGSMGPKMQAAVSFLRGGGQEVIVCRPELLADAIAGRTGTRIRP
ncbi:MAG: carbamate kinase [Deltaproteobacteria bacterium]|nr:MAG: carbamate kinase [Deltaproteobacteria bacterium]